jgi:hypothetical protein
LRVDRKFQLKPFLLDIAMYPSSNLENIGVNKYNLRYTSEICFLEREREREGDAVK